MKQSILKDNIQAAVYLSNTLASTLGPKGMDKLLVDNLGDTFVTNDGATIVGKIEIQHPVAKLISRVAATMEEEIGDGTTSAVILTGELLKQAQELINQGMHPTKIINGYRQALKDSLKILESKSKKIQTDDVRNLISTALTGKVTNKEQITKVVMEAIENTEINNILIIKKKGQDTKVIKGVIIDKERVHPRMPEQVKNARVLVTKTPLEVRNPETDAEITINNPTQLASFLEKEHQIIQEMIKVIKDSGANVVLCQKGIDDKAQELLARAGIMAIRRIREKDIEALVLATGARLTELGNLKPSDLGRGYVTTERVGDERLTIIKQCPGNVKTILIKGSTEQLIDETERCIKDALGIIKTIRENEAYVPGAGSIENILYKELMKKRVKGREQLSYEGFAKAMKSITKTLIKNSGQNPLDLTLNENEGVNSEGGTLNPLKEGIIEPLKLKNQAITSATETAVMILRIDEILKGK